jgi:RES domain-containing protein
MRLHRISLAACSATAAAAFSGRGGLFGKGRWHTQGRLVVYASAHASLAMAESLVHLQRSNSIEPFYRWEIEVPDPLITRTALPPAGWENQYALTQPIGDAWLAGGASVGLLVPSAVVPNELNCLLNPSHPAFDLAWVVSGPHSFAFDRRLTRP